MTCNSHLQEVSINSISYRCIVANVYKLGVKPNYQVSDTHNTTATSVVTDHLSQSDSSLAPNLIQGSPAANDEIQRGDTSHLPGVSEEHDSSLTSYESHADLQRGDHSSDNEGFARRECITSGHEVHVEREMVT